MIYICDNIIIFNYLTYVMPAACVSILTSWLSHFTLLNSECYIMRNSSFVLCKDVILSVLFI